MEAEIWGPIFWNLLFDVAHYYMQHNNSTVVAFLQLTQFVLPCETCRKHYTEYLDYCGDEMKNCEDVGLNFLYPLRCRINFRLLKPNIPVKTYKTRRIHFPLTGNGNSLQKLIYLLETKIPSIDPMVRVNKLGEWCRLAIIITQPIQGYGTLVRLECLKAVSTAEITEATSSEIGKISAIRSG